MYSPNENVSIGSVEQLRDYVREEFRAISRELAETTALELRVRYAEPIKPREGMIVAADGVEWEPDGASGAGIYAYIGGTWIPLHT